MNASTPRRTDAALRGLCAVVPATLAAWHVPNVADAAHDRGVHRVLGLHPEPWRALDVAAGALLAPLPLGTRATRAALGGAIVAGAAGPLLYDLVCRLLTGTRWQNAKLPLAVAAIATLTALVSTPWQMEAAAVGGSALGAWLVLLTFSLALHACDSDKRGNWIAAAAACGLALGYDPGVFATTLAGCGAWFAGSPKSRAALSRACRDHPLGLAGAVAMGLIPTFAALARVRAAGGSLSEGLTTAWAGEGVASSRSWLDFAKEDIGPVLSLLAVAGAGIGGLRERSRPAVAGLVAILLASGALAAAGAPVGPARFAAPILAAVAAACALAAVSMGFLLQSVASARVPTAGAAAVMVVVLELVLPVETADNALTRCEARASGLTSWWDDAVWGTLEPGTMVVIDNAGFQERAAASRAQGALRSDVAIVPAKRESVARAGAFGGDPDVLRLWRDLALYGAPSEATLSSIATKRPVVASYEPSWGHAVGRHFVPLTLVDRVEPEPRGATDRLRSLDAYAATRARLAARIAGDLELMSDASSLLRARAVLFSAIGDRDLAERASSDARLFEPDR